ncbi:6-hydroxymethylpterin diphosphokinase MptE-like protein [Methanoplanus limicola]|uniref:6-hydroxymethyl-7,8-dihydropterin pyrophosphokinase n=1 Tax=Methanoplanus limicola DSM 2279 TaxID=937775 RepID=H1Z3Y7_9EURY|nr:6-hydroxymethylpterin diphosphokinase MptE-like protein [Methanoplanus limicola]EHQ36609.1 protein of unknown function DUF115 [Methanoplanus limicola DSM 2279]
MKFKDWEPHYTKILDYFGFEREGDEKAAVLSSELTDRDDINLLKKLCEGSTVTVCGNAPCLDPDIKKIKGKVLAADAASERLYKAGILPDAIFTDLDGCDESFIEMNDKGTIIVVHAHGDNIFLLKNWIPRFKGPLVITTQSEPFSNVHNYGGFTDGDRAAFTADEFGAEEIIFAGFDLDDRSVNPMKRGKLMIARDLLSEIGYEI